MVLQKCAGFETPPKKKNVNKYHPASTTGATVALAPGKVVIVFTTI